MREAAELGGGDGPFAREHISLGESSVMECVRALCGDERRRGLL
jgi:hypothetical protein